MKKYRILLLLIFTVTAVKAQWITVSNTLANPSGVATDGFIVHYADETSGIVRAGFVRTFINSPQIVTDSVVITGLSSPRNMIKYGGKMYIRESNKISEWDIIGPSNQVNPVFVRNLDSVFSTGGMGITKSYLFFTERTTGKVRYFDLLQTNPVAMDLHSGLNNPSSLAFINSSSQIAREFEIVVTIDNGSGYDLVRLRNASFSSLWPIAVDTLYTSAAGAIPKDMMEQSFLLPNSRNSVFILEGGSNPRLIGVKNILVFNTPIISVNLFTNLANPNFFDLAILGPRYFHFSELTTPGRVRAITNFGLTTSNEEPKLKKSFIVYPNPSSHQITIEGIDEPQEILIFDYKGSLVLHQVANSGQPVSISELPAGVYFLKVGYSVQKIIKE